jgi:Ankyrin repeats (3 copies)
MAEQAPKKQRTIQVKIGNQAARAMTPDQAADYLKSIAGKGWGSGRELKMTFDNGSTSTVALPRTTGLDSSTTTASRSTSTRADGMPCSEKEMKALMSMFVEIMGLQMNTDRLNQVKSVTKQNKEGALFQFPADLPPPPGGWPEDLMWPMEDSTDENDSVDSIPELEEIPEIDRPKMIQYAKVAAKKAVRRPKPVTPIPPVPGAKETAPVDVNAPVTGTAGIAPFEWGALERAAIEDALEQEERIRKDTAGNNGSKKKSAAALAPKIPAKLSSSSSTATSQEAAFALQKVEAANKKLGKAVSMWRSRVAAAVTQNEVSKLEALLAESPLPAVTNLQQKAATALTTPTTTKPVKSSSSSNPHLEFLVPLTVPKNAASTKGIETRIVLAKYLLQDFSPTHFFAPGRNGRSAIHMACLYADYPVLKMIVEKARKKLTAEKLCDALQEPCQDSGWTPLHYAVASGSMRTVETLFKSCGDKNLVQKLVQTVTNDMNTWKRGTNKGVTAQYLAEALVSCKHEKLIETHGMALLEVVQHYKLKAVAIAESSVYVQQVSAISKRLIQIETLGYTPMNEKELARAERELASQQEQQRMSSASVASATSARELQGEALLDSDDDETLTAVNTKKKAKKKKKGTAASVSSKDMNSSSNATEQVDQDTTSAGESEASKPSAATVDPLVTALLGMGFEHHQIMEGIKACGGMSRATADNVVAWIFGGGEPNALEEQPDHIALVPATKMSAMTILKNEAERRNVEVATQKEEERLAAEKLAVKREEQRRRNREWNNRAQARQIQEAQEKLAKSAQIKGRAQGGGLRTGLAPASNFFPSNPASGVRGPSPTFGVAQTASSGGPKLGLDTNATRKAVSTATRMVGRLNLGPSAADAGIENYSSNDVSTVASSVDHGTIEVGGNDDATVSTIGSFPVQPPTPSSYAPPGFAGGQMLPPMDGQQSRELQQSQWEAQRSFDTYGVGGTFTPLGNGGMGPPPGIPESGPLLGHGRQHVPVMRSHSLNLPTHTSRLPPATLNSFSASSDLGSNLFGGNTSLARSDNTQYMGGGLGSSLLSGGFANPPLRSGVIERGATAPAHMSSLLPEAPAVPGLFGFGSDLNQKTLDSSIIDSISTGNTAIGGSALWGGSSVPATGGSSLLGNLINNAGEYQNENSHHHNESDSLFSNGAFQSGGASWERDRMNNVQSSGGGGNSSIW